MVWSHEILPTNSGAQLRLYSSLPDRLPKAVLQINHGMAEHAGRYERFATYLRQAGYATYAHDHRGHGFTTSPGTTMGMFAKSNGWDAVISDVAAVNAEINKRHENMPVVCFGHSMGAIIALNHILNHPKSIAGAAIWNSGVETGLLGIVFGAILRLHRMFKGSDVPSVMAHQATFETWNKQFSPNRTDCDWLSRDEAEVDKYVNDPLCGFPISGGLWLDLLQGIYFAANDKNLASLPKSLPMHLLAGGADPCSEFGKALANLHARLKQSGLQDLSLEILPDTRHESLNEINRDQTTASFIDWLDCHFA
ncbi:MAG: alpha/beta fold hydrolase [Rhizobiaceae bacterium]